MKPTQLPTLKPMTNAEKLRRYTLDPAITRRRRKRNQRIGDMALGAFFFGVAWIAVHIIAGAW